MFVRWSSQWRLMLYWSPLVVSGFTLTLLLFFNTKHVNHDLKKNLNIFTVDLFFRNLARSIGCNQKAKMQYHYVTGSTSWFFIRTGGVQCDCEWSVRNLLSIFILWLHFLILFLCRTKASRDSCISEHLLPRFLDLVIWGHEHECLINPQVTGHICLR
jgi:hypothetical protein